MNDCIGMNAIRPRISSIKNDSKKAPSQSIGIYKKNVVYDHIICIDSWPKKKKKRKPAPMWWTKKAKRGYRS